MKYFISVLIISTVGFFVGCGSCENNTEPVVQEAPEVIEEYLYDPQEEIMKMSKYLDEFCPDALGDERDRIAVFRDHLHWINRVETGSMSLPLEATVYKDTVMAERGNLCGGLSMLFAAYLQATGVEFRHVSLFSGEVNSNDVVQSHSVIEVKDGEKWVMHDVTYNCIFTDKEGNALSVEDIQDRIENEEDIIIERDGYEAKDVFSLIEEKKSISLEFYKGYFKEIEYGFQEVFF